jgi:hypothetical protein
MSLTMSKLMMRIWVSFRYLLDLDAGESIDAVYRTRNKALPWSNVKPERRGALKSTRDLGKTEAREFYKTEKGAAFVEMVDGFVHQASATIPFAPKDYKQLKDNTQKGLEGLASTMIVYAHRCPDGDVVPGKFNF